MLVDGAREIIGLSLNKLGYSLNDTNNTHLREAESNLTKLGPNVKGVVGDEVTMMLEQHEANIAVVWSGVAAPIVQENDDFDYVVPKEGSNLWFDNMVIPKTAQNKAGAYKFMNFYWMNVITNKIQNGLDMQRRIKQRELRYQLKLSMITVLSFSTNTV